MKRLKIYFTGTFLLFSVSCIILYSGIYTKFYISHLIWSIITILQFIEFAAISLLMIYLSSDESINFKNPYSLIPCLLKNNKYLLNKISKYFHFNKTDLIKK